VSSAGTIAITCHCYAKIIVLGIDAKVSTMVGQLTGLVHCDERRKAPKPKANAWRARRATYDKFGDISHEKTLTRIAKVTHFSFRAERVKSCVRGG
jgi:hypothetical protein